MQHTYYSKEILKKFFLISFLALCSFCAHPLRAKEKINTGTKPQWVEEIALSTESRIKPEDVSDGYLFILRDYQYHVGERTNYFHYVKKIYSSTGVQKGAEIEVSYDPTYEKVIFHEIKIIRDNQQINKLEPHKFKVIQRERSKESYIYDGSLSALLILEDVRADDLIEYSFSIVGRNPIYAGKFFTSFYLAFYDPLDQLFIKVISPKEKPLHIKNEQTTYKPSIAEEGSYTVYRWNLAHIEGISMDADTPYWYNPYPHVWVSEFSSWKEVNEWALKLYTTPVLPGKKLQEAIAGIKSSHKTPEGRLEAALKIVQDEVRYTGLESGIGGYKPRDPSEVFDQKFGDCKDKSLLFCYMLNQMDMQAYPALVHTGYRQEIKNWLPTPIAFNHCIAQVQLSGKTYWYDPTQTNQGGRYNTMYFPNYKCALVISTDTKGLTDIPSSGNSKTKVVETFMINDIGGPVELSITTEYHGYDANDQRYYFSNNNIKQIEKNYLNYNAKNYAELEVSKPLLTSDNRDQNVFTTYENYTITNFWYAPDSTQPGNLQCLTFPQSLRDKIVVPGRPIRTMPVGLEYPLEYAYTVNLILPETWTFTPNNIEIKNAGVYFTQETSYKNDVITISYLYKTLKDHITAKETAAFIKNQNQIIDQLGYSLTYNKEAVNNFQTNWLMVVLTIIAIGMSIAGVYKIYQFDPAPDRIYAGEKATDIGGWLIVVALGICITPIRATIDIFANDYYNLTTWQNLTIPTSPAYNLKLAILIVIEVFYNVFFLAYSILLIVTFFKKRSSFPLLMAIRYGGSIFFIGMETYILYEMNLLDKVSNAETIKDLTQLIVGGAIWVPYLYLSERSKETFVHMLKVPEHMQEAYRLKA